MSEQWRKFWDGYRNDPARSEADLFVQVGKTIAREPIPAAMFQHMVQRIAASLQIGPDDHVLDLCCGNGLISCELSALAGKVTGVDFAQHLIDTAQAFKQRPNIDYRVGDVTQPLDGLLGNSTQMPGKVLMNDALAYFEPDTLAVIVGNISAARAAQPFRFLLTGIPNDALKWNFYDTTERKLRYQQNQQAGDAANDGLGRWWSAAEIQTVASAHGLHVQVENQPDGISSYRMDALIWRD